MPRGMAVVAVEQPTSRGIVARLIGMDGRTVVAARGFQPVEDPTNACVSFGVRPGATRWALPLMISSAEGLGAAVVTGMLDGSAAPGVTTLPPPAVLSSGIAVGPSDTYLTLSAGREVRQIGVDGEARPVELPTSPATKVVALQVRDDILFYFSEADPRALRALVGEEHRVLIGGDEPRYITKFATDGEIIAWHEVEFGEDGAIQRRLLYWAAVDLDDTPLRARLLAELSQEEFGALLVGSGHVLDVAWTVASVFRLSDGGSWTLRVPEGTGGDRPEFAFGHFVTPNGFGLTLEVFNESRNTRGAYAVRTMTWDSVDSLEPR